MITLKRVKIRGFRGFMSDREFIFDNPAVFLFGESHHGKSSTLNAIEWCLFGGECIGLRTGIRERVDWEIPNRNMNLPDVLVELELKGSDGLFIIQRTLKPRARRGGLQEELSLMLPDSTKLSEEQAKERLAQLLRSSFRDFMTTVYQHQEAIRAVLTQEPRERNDAIDRLLGLSDYRDLLDGINAAQLPTKQRQIDEKFEAFNREVETALRTRERSLSEKRQGATESGTAEADLNGAGGLRIAHEVLGSLTCFASEVGISPPIVKVPVDWKGLKKFRESAKKEIGRMRAEMPDVEEQENLFQRRGQLTNLKTQYESKKQSYKEALQKLQEFEKENGDEPAISSKIEQTKKDIDDEKTKLREANERAALVQEAIKYLEKADINKVGKRCPICGNEAPDLLGHLREEWEQELKTQVEDIQTKIDPLEKQRQGLEIAARQHKNLEGQLKRASGDLQEGHKQVSDALGRKITEEDDPVALLNIELEYIKGRLQELTDAVRTKQERLTAIERELEKVGLIVDILELEEEKKVVEKIKESPDYKQLESFQNQIAQFVDDVEKIREAISAASNEEAQNKIASAKSIIDRYFRKLSNHPAVTLINLDVEVDSKTGRNAYKFTDQNGKFLTPILNQGDLNALALAIFLGLACSNGDTQRFGFVMLDDPSQSLGSEHKKRLAEVLNDVLEQKRIILSTMDTELQGVLLQKLMKAKTTYTFSYWTPVDGPQVQKE